MSVYPNLCSKVELYYMILERLEKYQEALDVVRGKLGGNLSFSAFGQLTTPAVWRFDWVFLLLPQVFCWQLVLWGFN